MITQFKIFENKDTAFFVGDYVSLTSGFGNSIIWNKWYGKIINLEFNTSINDYLYRVKFFNNLSELDEKFLRRNSHMAGVNSKNSTNSMAINKSYLIKYDTKEEFDKAVEEIEMEKTAKKFGL